MKFDHVNLLLALTLKVRPSAFVNNLRTITNRLLRKEFRVHLKTILRKQGGILE